MYSPSMTAVVNGKSLDVSQVSIDRSLPDPLAGGSLTAASGSFTAVEGEDVVSTVATPWDPSTVWPPVPESPASVSMDTGAGSVALLTGGRVVSASGGTSGREVDVEVADRYQSLDKSISWDAWSASTPAPGEAVTSRYVGLQTTAITDRILRHCGWFSTPPRLSFASLSVPGQGTLWPESGTVVTSGRVGNSGVYPSWGNADWGVAATDAEATYTMAGAYSVKSRGRVELTAMTMGGTTSARIDVLDGSAFLFRMSWSDTTGTLWVRSPSDSIVSAISVPRTDGLLYGSLTYVDDTTVVASIRSGGQVQTTTVSVSSLLTTRTVRDATISVLGRAAGFQVAFPSAAGSLNDWTPNAVLYPRQSNRNNLMVAPDVQAENCADLLAAQCEAECATYWIDETGVLRWWDLARLEATPVVATLTSDDDIAEAGFTWSHDQSSVRSRASVKWREPSREWNWRSAVDLWQGPGKTLGPNETVEELIDVPADEIWLVPDLVAKRVSTTGSGFNDGWGTWYGGIISTAGSEPDEWAYAYGSLLMTLEKITSRVFKSTIAWTGTDSVILSTPGRESTSWLWKRRRDFDLPIIRGKARITFFDQVTYSAQDRGDASPEHTIDAGWWIQDAAQAQYTADYAGARVTVPQPTLSSVALIPFPGLQLGDVVEVQDKSVARITVRGIVIEDSRNIDADMGMSHAVAIRPTSVSRNGVTWQDWAALTRPKTWSQWQTSEGGTWTAWGSNPLNT